MRRFTLVAAVVAAACAVFAGVASAQPFTQTLTASPNPVPPGGSFTLSGGVFDNGVGIPFTPVLLGVMTPDCGFGIPIAFTLTDGNGNYSFGPFEAGTTTPSFWFLTESEFADSGCLRVDVGFPPQVRQQDNTYLCYSKSEQDSGMVVPTNLVQQFMQGGYWKPSAIKGTAPSAAYTTAGKYYLACNPPASLKPTGFGVDLDGLDIYPMSGVYGNDATIFAIVA